MKITFDPKKAVLNHRKHGIRFSDAEFVFFDPHALTREDLYSVGSRGSYRLDLILQEGFSSLSSHTAVKKSV